MGAALVALEGLREAELAVADCCGDVADAEGAVAKQLVGALHPHLAEG